MSHARPNILILQSDQHNRHVLGCYGDRIVRTPSLDRLASEGMRFDATYCPSPLCVPSRMSFMTSRTPSHNRVWNNAHVLDSGIPTWAHVLGAAGYETALLGRMHFVGPDQRHGFEKRPIGEFLARHPGAPIVGGPMWAKYSSSATGQARKAVEVAGRGITNYQIMDRQVTEASLKYLRDYAAGPRSRPFAAVIGWLLPHCPFIAPRDLFDYYYDRIDIPSVEEDQPATVRRLRQSRGLLDPPLSDERIRIARAAYFGMVELLDRMVGQVLDCLDEAGLGRDTLVIYTSDHGDMAAEHGCWCKSSYYEGSVGVPMIARLPGVVPAAATCDAVCNLMDLGPTFAELAGTEFLPAPDGRSLLPLLRGQRPADWPDETFSELYEGRACRMIRRSDWKLWQYADEEILPPALFNLRNDPGELHDLGEDPGYAPVCNELLARLHADWDPACVRNQSQFADQCHKTLAAWGKAVEPPHEDTLPAGPPENEEIELL